MFYRHGVNGADRTGVGGAQVSDDLVTRLRTKYGGQLPIAMEAADEIERLRRERNEWFSAARQLRDALLSGNTYDADNAIDNYLLTRGNLEDPRDVPTNG